jgi:hypothetical protein
VPFFSFGFALVSTTIVGLVGVDDGTIAVIIVIYAVLVMIDSAGFTTSWQSAGMLAVLFCYIRDEHVIVTFNSISSVARSSFCSASFCHGITQTAVSS